VYTVRAILFSLKYIALSKKHYFKLQVSVNEDFVVICLRQKIGRG
jgi:hypothetical protein